MPPRPLAVDVPFLPLEGLQQLAQETRLLAVVQGVIEGAESVETARRLAQELHGTRRPSETVSDLIVTEALAVLAQEPRRQVLVEPPIPVGQHLADTLGLAWAHWMRGNQQEATSLLDKPTPHLDRQEAGSMTCLALRLWQQALTYLSDGQERQALTSWRRAIEVATIFGLEATSMIRWTYAASAIRAKEPPV